MVDIKSKIKRQAVKIPDEITAQISRELNEAMDEFCQELAKKLALSEQEAAKIKLR